MKPTVYPGERYGRLVVLELLPGRQHRKRVFRCICDCGSTTDVVGSALRSETTRSCGCLRVERATERIPTLTAANTRHGLTTGRQRPAIYNTWALMHGRCRNPNSPRYADYGGRGIKVCARWSGRDGFLNFAADMGDRPSPRHSLDRIDVNGHYEPRNCRWATARQQANNKRNNRLTNADVIAIRTAYGRPGATQRQLAVEYGVSPSTIARVIGPPTRP